MSEAPKTQTFSRQPSDGKTVPMAWFVGLAAVAFGGGGAAGTALTGTAQRQDPAVVEAITKVDRKADLILARLDSFEPRLSKAETSITALLDRVARLEASAELDAKRQPR